MSVSGYYPQDFRGDSNSFFFFFLLNKVRKFFQPNEVENFPRSGSVPYPLLKYGSNVLPWIR